MRIRWWHGLVFFFAALGVQLLLVVLLTVAQAFGLFGSDPEQIVDNMYSPALLSFQVLLTSAILTGLALGLPLAFRVTPRGWLRLAPGRLAVYPLSVFGMIGAGFLIDEVTFVLHSLAPTVFEPAGLDMLNEVFLRASPLVFAGLTLVISVGPGIGEEMFFRGFILRAFRTDFPPWLAVFVSAFLFGVLHLNVLQGTGAGLIGVYLGFVALQTGSLWPAVLAHAVNNLLCAVFARFDPQGVGQVWATGHPPLLVLGAAAITAASIYALVRLSRHPRGN